MSVNFESYKMNEVRIRQRPFLIAVTSVSILVVYLLFRTCEQTTVLSTSETADNSLTRLPNEQPLPFTVYAITPTYARPVQKAELTRIAQTLLLVPYVHWILIEDADHNSELVKNLLTKTGLSKRSTLLAAATPPDFKLKKKDPTWMKARGVNQRNTGLTWIKSNVRYAAESRSVIYFMDDDNTYDTNLFEEMKKIEAGRVGVWPVGLVGGLLVEKPVLDEDNRVMGFNSVWRPERPFPIDMAGFAISTDLILKNPQAVFSYDIERGYQESEILRYLVVVRDLQPCANLCRDVLVWHTRTETPKLEAEYQLRKGGQQSNAGMEV